MILDRTVARNSVRCRWKEEANFEIPVSFCKDMNENKWEVLQEQSFVSSIFP